MLAGVARDEVGNPFGDYVGTWDMPKNIQGPFHLVTTGRSQKNVKSLFEKKSNTDKLVNEARENQVKLYSTLNVLTLLN